MLERIRAALYQICSPHEDRILIGLSGGADSVCMTHLLHRLGAKIAAAHLHHGLRIEANGELEQCQAWCTELDIDFIAGRADIGRMMADMKVGEEEAGRMARMQFLEQAAAQTGCSLIALAHTSDDLVETVLFKLVRGGGMRAVTGIAARRDSYIRPILELSRAETKAYCVEHELWHHDEAGNHDLAHARVRIRKNVVPELEQIQPNLRESILRFSKIVQAEDEYLDQVAAAALEHCEVKANGDLHFLTTDCELVLNRKALNGLPPALLKRAIRLAARVFGAEMDFEQTESTAEGIAQGLLVPTTVEGGRVHIRVQNPDEGEGVFVERDEETEPFRHPLTIPGETIAEIFGWQFTAFYEPPTEYQREPKSLDVKIARNKIKGDLYFRTPSTGEKVTPLGLKGTKLISDLYQEARLTKQARKRLPIICDMVGPVWIPGVAVMERVKIDDETKEAIRLQFGPASS